MLKPPYAPFTPHRNTTAGTATFEWLQVRFPTEIVYGCTGTVSANRQVDLKRERVTRPAGEEHAASAYGYTGTL